MDGSGPPSAVLPVMPSSPVAQRRLAAELRAVDALERAGRLLEEDEARMTPVDALGELDLACSLLEDRLRDGGTGLARDALARAVRLLVELEEVRAELREAVQAERYAGLTGIQAGLARLRGAGSTDAMLDKATEEVCHGCGFDRAILFRVVDSHMVPESVYYVGDPEGAAALLAVGRAAPRRLDQALMETEMVRRRAPMLVLDAQNAPNVHVEIAEASGSISYVAAPIMPSGRVIGFLHADRFYEQRQMTEFDRDMLWAFAEGFGYAYERQVLLERLRGQRDRVRSMVGDTQDRLDALARGERPAPVTPAADAGGGLRPDELLTPRELEVLGLMAAGHTNAAIAAELVVSEGTVKSHVKRILRKLGAANRAEAVSRFLHASAR